MKRLSMVMALFMGLAMVTVAYAERIYATLTGSEEVPVVNTDASGELRGMISRDDSSIDYELTYSGLQGIVTQAHIHVAQPNVNGGIVIWLCGTNGTTEPPIAPPTPGPAGTPTCTPGSGIFTGTITAANVVAITGANAGQQIGNGDFEAVIAAMRAGNAYANVHTNLSPGGEIRGQIRASSR